MPTSPENEETPDTALGRLMDEQRNELGLLWEDVAELSGLSRQTLFDIRKGHVDYHRMRSRTRRKIEQAFQWERGSIEEFVLTGKRPVSVLVDDEEESRVPGAEPAIADLSEADRVRFQMARDFMRTQGRELTVRGWLTMGDEYRRLQEMERPREAGHAESDHVR